MNMARGIALSLWVGIACGDDGGAPAATDTEAGTSTGAMTLSTTVTPSTSGDPSTTTTEGSESSGGSESGTTTGSTGDSGSTSEGSSSSTGIDGIAVPFHLTNFADATPFPDVDVCFLDNGSCDVSDRMGDGEIVGPLDTNLTIDITGGGAFPTRYPVRFPDDGLDAFISTLTQAEVGLLFLSLGYEEIPVEGTVAVLVVDENGNGLPGATISIDPPTDIAPIYFGNDNAPDPMLTATEAGLGVFIEVEAGDYEVWIEHAAYDCPPSPYAWPGTLAERSALTVVDGILTIPFVSECTPT